MSRKCHHKHVDSTGLLAFCYHGCVHHSIYQVQKVLTGGGGGDGDGLQSLHSPSCTQEMETIDIYMRWNLAL